MESDKEKLKAGEIDPNAYYEDKAWKLINRDETKALDSLSSDTSRITPEEQKMLSKFSSDNTDKNE